MFKKFIPHVAGAVFTAALATAIGTTQPLLIQRLAYESPSTESQTLAPPPALEPAPSPPPPSGDQTIPAPSGEPGQIMPPPSGEQQGPMMPPPSTGGEHGPTQPSPPSGPSEADMKRMEAERARREQEGLKQMQRGVKQFALQLKRLKTRVAALERQGVPISQDTKDTLAKAEAAVNTIASASSMEDAQSAIEELQDVGENMGEMMQTLEMLARLPRVVSQAEREVKRVQTSFNRLNVRASKSKIDLADPLAKVEQLIANLNSGIAKAKELAAQSQGEEAMDTLQSEVFEQLEDVGQAMKNVEALLGLSRFFTQVDRDLRRYDTLIARAKRQKKDIGEAESILAEAKEKIAALKAQAQGGQISEPDEIFSALEELSDLRASLDEALGIGGQASPIQGGPMPGGPLPKLELPSSIFGNGQQGGANQNQPGG